MVDLTIVRWRCNNVRADEKASTGGRDAGGQTATDPSPHLSGNRPHEASCWFGFATPLSSSLLYQHTRWLVAGENAPGDRPSRQNGPHVGRSQALSIIGSDFTKGVGTDWPLNNLLGKKDLALAIAAPLLMITLKSRKVLRGEVVVWWWELTKRPSWPP